MFVGKLIASKGVELLLAAWPLVLAREPAARLVIVGFGGFRAGLEALAGRARRPATWMRPARTRGEDGSELPWLAAFLDALEDRDAYRAAARGLPERVAFAGRLDHDELADLLPAAEAMAVTSTFPEAFGMVAAEAAACGALPGRGRPLGPGRGRPHAGRRRARTRAPVAHLRGRARAPWASWPATWRAGSPRPRRCARSTRAAMVAATRERYSWDGVARTVIAAARGRARRASRPVTGA